MAQSPSELVEQTAVCPLCGLTVVGLLHDGYLWPLWMREGCWRFPPKGPKLYNLELKECWKCSVKHERSWHRT